MPYDQNTDGLKVITIIVILLLGLTFIGTNYTLNKIKESAKMELISARPVKAKVINKEFIGESESVESYNSRSFMPMMTPKHTIMMPMNRRNSRTVIEPAQYKISVEYEGLKGSFDNIDLYNLIDIGDIIEIEEIKYRQFNKDQIMLKVSKELDDIIIEK